MKVLVNALSARKGGIVTYTRNLLEALAARGVDSVVAVPEEFAADPRTAIRRFDVSAYSPARRFIWDQSTWREVVRRIKPDILFSSANFGLFASPVRQILLLREGGLFDPFYLANMTPEQGVEFAFTRIIRRRLMLLSARTSDHIVVPTEAMRDMIARWYPNVGAKCSVNPYGTLSDKFVPADEPRPWRDGGVLKLLYVSVYYPHKVPGLICRAVDRLNESGLASKATITMSLDEFPATRGGTLDGNIVAEANARGIISLGHHDYASLPDLYRGHDVFVFPSVSETFGHPMAEAMSSGLPVVAADTPVNREICGDAALYFAPFSISGMIEQVRRMDADPALRERMAKAGRQRVSERFGWNAHVDRLIGIFESVAAAKS